MSRSSLQEMRRDRRHQRESRLLSKRNKELGEDVPSSGERRGKGMGSAVVEWTSGLIRNPVTKAGNALHSCVGVV